MSAIPTAGDLHASIRQAAARALLEGATLDAAVAEILRALSTELDWPLALYWIAGPDDRALRCRSIWASDALKRADVVEASRVAIIADGAKDDPAVRAYEGREPVWIEDLSAAPPRPPPRDSRWRATAGLTSSSSFPISDNGGFGRRRSSSIRCASARRTTRRWR